MAKLMNWTNAPVVVTDKAGERHTIPALGEIDVEGDFTNHLYVKNGDLSLDGAIVATTRGEREGDELHQLRIRFQSIFGKAAPSAAKAETLRQRIKAWQDEQGDGE